MKTRIPGHNRIRDQRSFRFSEHAIMVGSYFNWFKHDDLDLSPSYQRDYVWTSTEQDAFLKTLMAGFPCGVIAIAVDSEYNETAWVEVIDGKQRLTTLIKVYTGEISLPFPDGSRIFWDELPRHEQRAFENLSLPAIGLEECTHKDRLNFFFKLNFAGVPQSEDHKNKILEMLK